MEKGIMCPSQTLVDNNRAKFMNCQDFLTRYGIFKQFLLNTTVQYTLCQTYTKELLYSTSRKMINVRTTGRPKFIRAKSSARLLCCVQGLYLNRLRPRKEARPAKWVVDCDQAGKPRKHQLGKNIFKTLFVYIQLQIT